MKSINSGCHHFLDKKDSFQTVVETLDAFFHKLHSDEIVIQVNHTEILTKEDEEKLWR